MRDGLKNKGGYVIIDELKCSKDDDSYDVIFDDESSAKLYEAAKSGKMVIIGEIIPTNYPNSWICVTPCKFLRVKIEGNDEYLANVVRRFMGTSEGVVEENEVSYSACIRIYADGSADMANWEI